VVFNRVSNWRKVGPLARTTRLTLKISPAILHERLEDLIQRSSFQALGTPLKRLGSIAETYGEGTELSLYIAILKLLPYRSRCLCRTAGRLPRSEEKRQAWGGGTAGQKLPSRPLEVDRLHELGDTVVLVLFVPFSTKSIDPIADGCVGINLPTGISFGTHDTGSTSAGSMYGPVDGLSLAMAWIRGNGREGII
jgi:hypothetical protein